MNRINSLDLVALILIIIGGINWGLIGLFGLNLVEALFGAGTLLTRIVYILVGLSALYSLYTTFKVSSGSKTQTS